MMALEDPREQRERCRESAEYNGRCSKGAGLAEQVRSRTVAESIKGVATWQVTGTFKEILALGGSF